MSNRDVITLDQLNLDDVLPEYVFLGGEREEETSAQAHGKPRPVHKRALHGFILLQNDQPGFIRPFRRTAEYWATFSLIGYAASLASTEGLYVQTGHWVPDLVNSRLFRIGGVLSMDLRSDPGFRGGEPSLWLRTKHSEYAMMSPFSFFSSLWLLTLACFSIGPCRVMSLEAAPPLWWPADQLSAWDGLKKAQRLSLLPAIRKQAVLSGAFSQPGRSELQAFSIAHAKGLVHSSGPTRGKRSVNDLAESETNPTDRPVLDLEIADRIKRCRLGDEDSVRDLMSNWLQIWEHARTGDLDLADVPELHSNWGLLDPWELGEPMRDEPARRTR